MSYYDGFTTPVTKYGLTMEPKARKDYFHRVKNNHQSLTVEETDLLVSEEFSFLGTIPDGLLHWTCHGRILLEIKCPFNHQEGLKLAFGYKLPRLERKHEDQSSLILRSAAANACNKLKLLRFLGLE